jgi:hypothetical protein
VNEFHAVASNFIAAPEAHAYPLLCVAVHVQLDGLAEPNVNATPWLLFAELIAPTSHTSEVKSLVVALT